MWSKLLVAMLLLWGVESFPDGAPIDACVKDRPNQPNHGQHRTQPLSTLPYRLLASATNYGPNTPITGAIRILPDQLEKAIGIVTYTTHEGKIYFIGKQAYGLLEVTIEGAETFKGFFIQARSVEDDRWLGSWEQAPNTTVHPECASITHADPREKTRATLVWRAPPDAQGRVYFTGTVLKNYGTFWANLIAEAPQDPAQLQILG